MRLRLYTRQNRQGSIVTHDQSPFIKVGGWQNQVINRTALNSAKA